MDALLYLTVWIALSLFAIAELAGGRASGSWPRAMSAAGLALMVAHILIAMGTRHDWQHASAVAATARQTREVYGVEWGWGVGVNYAFTIVWGLSLVPRFQGAGVSASTRSASARPRRSEGGPGFWVRFTRVLFLIVIANAAIVFAAGWRRLLGVAIVGVLALSWSRRRPGDT